MIGYWNGGTEWNLIGGYSPEWEVVTTGDFNADGKSDTLWKNSFVGADGNTYNAYCAWLTGEDDYWRMIGVANPDDWTFLAAGDFNASGTSDIAMINGDGAVGIWGISNAQQESWSILSAVDTAAWDLAGVGDFNGDGTDDIAWCNSDTGYTGYWQINDRQMTAWNNIGIIA